MDEPAERTDAEIVARVNDADVVKRDWFGFERTDLIMFLPFDLARQFMKDGGREESEAEWTSMDRDIESVKAIMLDYMPFAFDKANNHRGLSAMRSISHMAAWLWMAGWDEFRISTLFDYEYYGKLELREICDEFGWDWRQWDDGVLSNRECD